MLLSNPGHTLQHAIQDFLRGIVQIQSLRGTQMFTAKPNESKLFKALQLLLCS